MTRPKKSKQKKRKAREYWIAFHRFHEIVIECSPNDTREYIAHKLKVVNPAYNLICVKEILPKRRRAGK